MSKLWGSTRNALLTFVVCGAFAGLVMAGCDSGTKCGSGQTDCNGKCVDLATDNGNCGKCGTKCDTSAGFICSAKNCTCAGGKTECGGSCVDTNTDKDNCGGCDNACGAGELCDTGTCTAGGCDPPKKACGGACIDPQSSNEHCGDCDQPCDVTKGLTCLSGACDCGRTTDELCGDECVDTNTNSAHCGACDQPCPAGESCVGGTCGGCPAPFKICGGDCVDPSSSNAHCGDCDQPCVTANGFDCVSGSCQCTGGDTDCGGTCVDTMTNPAHCGGCDQACTTGQVCLVTAGVAACSDLTCPPPHELCAGACVDTDISVDHCGGCGQPCTGGMVCNTGACECPITLPDECDGTCTDVDNDPDNCGACDSAAAPTQCPAGEMCANGSCTGAAVSSVQVTCQPSVTDVPKGMTLQCTATGIIPGGSPIDLTGNQQLTFALDIDSTNGSACSALHKAAGTPTTTLDDGTATHLVAAVSNTTTDPDKPKGQLKTYYKVYDNAGTLVWTNDLDDCVFNLTATYVFAGGTTTINSTPVVFSLVDRTLSTVAIAPDNVTVPLISGLKVHYKVMGTWDSGVTESLTADNVWVVGDPGVGTFADASNGIFGLVATGATTISVTHTEDGTAYPASTDVTVVAGTLTGLALQPSTEVLALGGTAAFNVVGTFNGNLQFDVTKINVAPNPLDPRVWSWQHYSGGPAVVWDEIFPAGGPYLTQAANVDPETGQWEWVADQNKTTPAGDPTEVEAEFTVGANTLTALAEVTIGDKELDSCEIRDENNNVVSTTTFPVGLVDVQFKAYPTYTDGSHTPDITDDVIWGPQGPVISADNATGHEGEVDMLQVGSATLEADPSPVKAGVAKCTLALTVVDNVLCELEVVPKHKGEAGDRRVTRVGAGAGAVGHPETDRRPILPNEANWTQGYAALAWYSTTTTCPARAACIAGNGCFSADRTADATWELYAAAGLPDFKSGDRALTNSGGGVFTVRTSTTNPKRAEYVKATYGSKTDILPTYVCGVRDTAGQPAVYATWPATDAIAAPKTTADTIAVGNTTQYHLVRQFIPASGDCSLAAWTNTTPATTWSAFSYASYWLDVTEDAQDWSSADTTYATVSNAANTRGEITGVAPTTGVNIIGNFGGLTAFLPVIVATEVGTTCTITTAPVTVEHFTAHGTIPGVAQFRATMETTAGGAAVDITNGFACVEDPNPSTNYDCKEVQWTASACGDVSDAPYQDLAALADAKGGGIFSSSTGGGCQADITVTCVDCGLEADGVTEKDITCTLADAVTVNNATVTGVFIQTPDRTCLDTPADRWSLTTQTGVQLYGCVVYSNGAVKPVDDLRFAGDDAGASWGGGGIVTVNQSGYVLAGVNAGTDAQITLTYTGGHSDTMTVDVIDSDLDSIAIQSPNLGMTNCASDGCVLEGIQMDYQVIGTRIDGTTQDITSVASAVVSACGSIATFGRVAWGTGADCTGVLSASLGALYTEKTFTRMDAEVNVISVAWSPGTSVTGGGKGIRGKVSVTTMTNPGIIIDVTLDAKVSQDNAVAGWIYPTGDLLKGWYLSRTVAAAQTDTVTTVFDTGVTAPGISTTSTITVNP